MLSYFLEGNGLFKHPSRSGASLPEAEGADSLQRAKP